MNKEGSVNNDLGKIDEDHSLSKGELAIDDSTDAGSATTHSTKKLEDNLDDISKCMKTSRIIILSTLLVVGAIAGGLTYYFSSQHEQNEFEDQVSRSAQYSSRLLLSFSLLLVGYTHHLLPSLSLLSLHLTPSPSPTTTTTGVDVCLHS